MDYLSLIGRSGAIFSQDIASKEEDLRKIIGRSRFLILGGSGSIGQSVVREVFKRDPKVLHVVDISENNLVELVRDIRSTVGYGSGDFRTFALDCGSVEFIACVKAEGPYDYVFNLSALKHVRSEKDPYTLMRMIMVNVFNTVKTLRLAKEIGAKIDRHIESKVSEWTTSGNLFLALLHNTIIVFIPIIVIYLTPLF